MPQYDFTKHDISAEQAVDLTADSERVYTALEDLLYTTPCCDVSITDIIPPANELLDDFLSQLDKRRRDRQYLGILGAAIVIELRKNDVPIRIDEIATLIRDQTWNEHVDKSKISDWKLKLDSHRGTLTTPAPVEVFVERYAAEVGMDDDVKELAIDLVDEEQEIGGGSPTVTAARAMWVACKHKNSDIKQDAIVDVAGTTSPSIRRGIEDVEAKIQFVV